MTQLSGVFGATRAFRRACGITAIAGVAGGATLSAPALTLFGLVVFANALAYNSVWMIAVGVLLKHWRVTLVGFEDAATADIKVDGPDGNNVVWIGRTYGSALDAKLAFEALAERIPLNAEDSGEIGVSGKG